MKAFVVYDSAYGNTAEIAQVMAEAVQGPDEAKAILVTDIAPQETSGVDLLVVGSPTQGGRPTKPLQEFLESLPDGEGKQAAAFDTRFAIEEQKFALRMLMKTIGFAAPKIGERLKKNGYHLAQEPEGFIVKDKEGPLRQNERERAAQWMIELTAKAFDGGRPA